jgi:GntR family transcriptional regulator
VVEAVTAQEELATLLKVEPGAPLLFVESVSWDQDLRPFECYRAWHRADRTKIEVQAVNQAVATRAGLDPTTLRLATR